MEIREDTLREQAKKWAETYLGESFSFRKYQLETIVLILQNYLYNTKIQVMEAPTGSGKSYIGIIVAGVLWEYYHKKSYILASDLSLYKQYEDTIKKFKLPWGMLKGQDNYLCHINGHKISMGKCKINQVSTVQICNPKVRSSIGYTCGDSCPYIEDMVEAARAPVTLLTYALYFIRVKDKEHLMFNVPTDGAPDINLYTRDFVICDEAHNLASLVQQQFSPAMDKDNLFYIVALNEFADKNGDKIPTVNDFQTVINYAIKFTDLNNWNAEGLKVCSERLFNMLSKIESYCTDVVRPTIKNYKSDEKREAIKYINAANSVRDLLERFRVFNSIINTYSDKSIVSSISKSGTGIKFNCAYEDKLIYEFFHKYTKSELLMSATIGDLDIYKKLIGADNYDNSNFIGIEVPSTFDFTQSPIYYDTRYKMSKNKKDESITKVVAETIEICNKNKNYRGIIHTGSYEISKAFYDAIPNSLRYRIIKYNDSSDKKMALQKFKNSQNGILVGPSLIEGLSFDDDLCRFNIFMKLPYASLGDNLVRAKMTLFPDWYSLDVCSRLEQGIGRGVRNKSDWCNCYILDGCIENILSSEKQLKNLTETTKKRLIRMY